MEYGLRPVNRAGYVDRRRSRSYAELKRTQQVID
jgi:hypothetical protein